MKLGINKLILVEFVLVKKNEKRERTFLSYILGLKS